MQEPLLLHLRHPRPDGQGLVSVQICVGLVPNYLAIPQLFFLLIIGQRRLQTFTTVRPDPQRSANSRLFNNWRLMKRLKLSEVA